MSPARAARLVITEQAFAIGGGKSDTGNTTHAPLVAGATVLARGASLFETLWLNLPPLTDRDPMPAVEDDAPVWERDPRPPHQAPGVPRGYLDYLTWQSRTLRVHPETGADGSVVVRTVSYAQGRRFEPPPHVVDPMFGRTRAAETDDWAVVRFNAVRDLWRDSAAMFQLRLERRDGQAPLDLAPATIRALAAADLKPYFPAASRFRLDVLGLCTDKAKVNYWRHESLPLPVAYLDNLDLADALRLAVTMAEGVARDALWPAACVTAENRLSGTGEGRPDADRVRGLVDSFAPERYYWSRLERPYREFLSDIAADGADVNRLLAAWFTDTLARTAEAAFSETIGRIDAGRDLRAVTAGRGVLAGRLARLRRDYRLSTSDEGDAA